VEGKGWEVPALFAFELALAAAQWDLPAIHRKLSAKVP
jgi:hypothetical protein